MNKVNYKRKAFRMLGLGFPVLYLASSQVVAVIVALALLILSLVFDVIRLRNKRLNEAAFKKIKILKEKERNKLSAITWFLAGVAVSLLVFPKAIAVLAIAFTVVGDAMAEIIGSRYRRIKMLDKSLEGNLACFISCVIIGLIFNVYVGVGLYILVTGAFAATIAQALPLRIDDNLSMQLVSGFVMMLAG